MTVAHGFSSGFKKVVVVGSAGCGKSALVQRYINNTFSTDYLQTYGADLYIKNTNENKKYSLQIWCCGGHERYRTLLDQFYSDINAALLCFDMQSQNSFQEIEFWYNELKRYAGIMVDLIMLFCFGLFTISLMSALILYRAAPDAQIILVGTKVDDSEATAVKIPDAMFTAKDWSVDFKAVSSKSGENIEDLFDQVMSKLG
ncbi:hypothetical protein BATDEDRAFT_27541 [Batrachochytrium dendrobatidis JAM81]|uniref:Small GTP-binding protein domain n=1 Tax=Batrachochytrium dendrobatidis (strain JAM81 / FGSC 10211) TaxID=684364 RepID=F4PB61_BATDJ|nr:uncharacterized protein BATDEDRAFT_27541 [Batrachochytrium dendrobatidis JAM81]EGF77664.1 hypothetical protein BATDEDRAFT_27541 [Batrachochytrium dendrobatidis JAM81]|eukprot:XP_006681696.1 hypothetical protein BATDEDRAFT_27541 [Batrachochytrium dendrobatidis JAM81]